MGDNFTNHRFGHQQRVGNKRPIPTVPDNVAVQGYKRIERMATSKALMTFLTWLGIPSTLLGLFADMNHVKATILYVAGLTMIVIRFSLWVYRVLQTNKLKSMEIKEKELDYIVRQQEMKQREIEQLERELDLRILLQGKKGKDTNSNN